MKASSKNRNKLRELKEGSLAVRHWIDVVDNTELRDPMYQILSALPPSEVITPAGRAAIERTPDPKTPQLDSPGIGW